MMKAAWPGRTVLEEEVHGRTCSLYFIRVGGDPFRSDRSATVTSGPIRVAQTGYFIAGERGVSSVGGDRASVAPVISEAGAEGICDGDGVFAFAAWNADDEQFFASVDKLGMRPLYWCEIPGGGVAVASEIKLLLPLLGEPRVNWSSWEDQVRLGFQIGEHTPVHGVFRFRRAGCLTWDSGRIRHTVLESFLESATEVPFRPDEFIEQNHHAFMSSLRDLLNLAGDDQLLLTVSAGLDSRRIMAGLRTTGRDIELLTASMPRASSVAEEMTVVQLLASKSGSAVTEIRPASADALLRVRRARDAYADFETDEHAVYSLFAATGVRRGINFDGMAGDTLLNPGQFLSTEFLGEGGEARFLESLNTSGGGDWARFPSEGEPFSVRVRAEWEALRGSSSAITLMALECRARRELALGPTTIQAHAFESVYPFLSREFMLSGLSLPPAERLRGLLQRQLTRRIDESLGDLISTRDPEFWSQNGSDFVDPLWLVFRPRLTVVRALSRGPSRARVPLRQWGKFLGAALLGPRIGMGRYDWQWGKADWFRRIREHEELVATGWQSYASFVANAVEPRSETVATRSIDP